MIPGHDHPDWPEALATVLSCTYTTRAGRALAFGMPPRQHFRITYNYWADGSLHEGEFFSEIPVPQGSLLPIRYDPTLPRNARPANSPTTRKAPLLAIGLAGSLILSLGWLLLLKGCT